ncbi:PucR family transcriptional regulator ligand-binding domain-containing protein [Streptomyces sp. DSM 42041]|uniref:PucR family transcriptional regulator ligand-binding domain-containing protein n=1 Tax=Streptomyces hazeniae TaxID=3075538 RepID=A0ABU2NTN7_9ACTN|nr:PucR family transcriptional regulator ligand-binding domain-containing protein [Streptomyces sp. DSM 42041]MDT0379337.1 PucR family transcriptional regulator ligand-binding domain-containing protein [Streptomyces sp. DSM 42041]
MPTSVADVLALPAVAEGAPQVLAGHDLLDRPVRWVHVSEVPEIAGLLQGGELLLTTGVALPDATERLGAYVDELAAAGVSGLVLELGRRFAEAPRPLVHAAARAGLPLVVLRREVRYVQVTQAAQELIAGEQFARLALSERIHNLFTTLSVEGAGTADVLRHTAELTGMSVVLENLSHQVLAHHTTGRERAALLRDWERRSREAVAGGRSGTAGPEGWLVTPVGARGEVWGRLILAGERPRADDHLLLVLERAATALAMNRLAERDRESLESHAHRTLLADLLHGELPPPEDVHAQTAALGVPTARRELLAVVVRLEAGPGSLRAGETPSVREQAQDREDAEAVTSAVRDAGVRALVAPLSRARVGLLLTLGRGDDPHAVLSRLAEAVHDRLARCARPRRGRLGVSTPMEDVTEVRRAFAEAEQVADAAAGSSPGRAYHRLPDVRVRGLLYLLRADPRVQGFVERELAPLLAYDDAHGTDLLGVLRAYLEKGRNKSAAADALHLSRPTFYGRLATVERVLEVPLDAPESALSLHVAVLALDAVRGRDGA